MWMRRDQCDLKNGIILTLVATIVVLYSKLTLSNLAASANFSAIQKAYDNRDHDFGGTPKPVSNIANSKVETVQTKQVYETETTHFDGLLKYTKINSDAEPNLLILVLTKDATSWGKDGRNPPRTVHDFLDLLLSTKINLSTTSLALWTSSPSEYALFRTATARLPLARTSIYLDPATGADSDRAHRHNNDPAFQAARRARVARLRNKLLLHALGNEPHLLWLDADVQTLSPGIVQLMLSHSSTNPAAGIITARCEDKGSYNYDKNAWGGGGRPGPEGTVSNEPEVKEKEAGMRQMLVDELIAGTKDSDLLPLDAVGGTILYMRAGLVWDGLNFPSMYVVGTRWGRDGWDGIETEGLCYVAKKLEGGGCYVLGGKNYVRHTNA